MKIKTEKEVVLELLENQKNQLVTNKVIGRFLQRKQVAGSHPQRTLNELAEVQSRIKDGEEFIKFLEEINK